MAIQFQATRNETRKKGRVSNQGRCSGSRAGTHAPIGNRRSSYNSFSGIPDVSECHRHEGQSERCLRASLDPRGTSFGAFVYRRNYHLSIGQIQTGATQAFCPKNCQSPSGAHSSDFALHVAAGEIDTYSIHSDGIRASQGAGVVHHRRTGPTSGRDVSTSTSLVSVFLSDMPPGITQRRGLRDFTPANKSSATFFVGRHSGTDRDENQTRPIGASKEQFGVHFGYFSGCSRRYPMAHFKRLRRRRIFVFQGWYLPCVGRQLQKATSRSSTKAGASTSWTSRNWSALCRKSSCHRRGVRQSNSSSTGAPLGTIHSPIRAPWLRSTTEGRGVISASKSTAQKRDRLKTSCHPHVTANKNGYPKNLQVPVIIAHPGGLEPPTPGLGNFNQQIQQMGGTIKFFNIFKHLVNSGECSTVHRIPRKCPLVWTRFGRI